MKNVINGFYKRAKNLSPGGIGDKKKASDFPASEVRKGVKVEMEHTNNKALAKEITTDHLPEDKKYYTKLDLLENPPKLDKDQKIIVDFLRKNPSPPDKKFHENAERHGVNEHKMEEKAYSLLGKFTNVLLDKK